VSDILFDLRMWNWTGVGRYSLNLFAALVGLNSKEASSFSFQALINSEEELPLRLKENLREESVKKIETKVKPFSLANFLGGNFFFPFQADLFHVPHFTLPGKLRMPAVVTIHDLIPLRYPVMSWWKRKVYYAWNKRAVLQARSVITDSHFTADLIHQFSSLPFEKVKVVYLAPDPIFYAEKNQETRESTFHRYFLAFANWRYHKGLDILLKGFSAAESEAKLLLVGKGPEPGKVKKSLLKLVERMLKEKRISFTGAVEDEQLASLYRGALAFIHPSREEGFGLPPLEAMASGTTVISADIPVSREILGESAIYYPVEDYRELSFILKRVENDLVLRKEYASRGRERASLFSWEKTAQGTMEVYRESLVGL